MNDSDAGSLRNAITSAGAGDTIQFQVTGTITLTSGELYIGQNLTITLSGLIIENGSTASTNGIAAGGGILNNGTLTITNTTVTGNAAAPFQSRRRGRKLRATHGYRRYDLG